MPGTVYRGELRLHTAPLSLSTGPRVPFYHPTSFVPQSPAPCLPQDPPFSCTGALLTSLSSPGPWLLTWLALAPSPSQGFEESLSSEVSPNAGMRPAALLCLKSG